MQKLWLALLLPVKLPRLRKRLEATSAHVSDLPSFSEMEGVSASSVSADQQGATTELDQQSPRTRKAERVAAVEEQLRSAREVRLQEDKWEKLATEIAQRIMNDMFDGRFNRVEAMVLFSQTASAQGVPDEVRVRVRKGFWGK